MSALFYTTNLIYFSQEADETATNKMILQKGKWNYIGSCKVT
jgi:hypothetical protein